ncbi:MAG TPA: hypothetical protein ENK18_16735 [Deltaproteobacteria bacterium]|nr:hypothetical protein [Deltaproteobacteria bacterium]
MAASSHRRSPPLLGLGLGLGLLSLATATGLGQGATAILQLQLSATACALACALIAGLGAIALLRGGGVGWEAGLQVSSQLAVGHCALLLILAALFSRPTWGRWWIWDPLLSTAAVGMVSFSAIHLLRAAVRDPERRTRWTAVTTLLAVLNLPLTSGTLVWRATTPGWSTPTITSALAPGLTSPGLTSPGLTSLLHTTAFVLCTLGLAGLLLDQARAQAEAEAPEPL